LLGGGLPTLEIAEHRKGFVTALIIMHYLWGYVRTEVLSRLPCAPWERPEEFALVARKNSLHRLGKLNDQGLRPAGPGISREPLALGSKDPSKGRGSAEAPLDGCDVLLVSMLIEQMARDQMITEALVRESVHDRRLRFAFADAPNCVLRDQSIDPHSLE
jgi:hypothetical protein